MNQVSDQSNAGKQSAHGTPVPSFTSSLHGQQVRYLKSSYCGHGNCVSVATLDDGRVLISDSKQPEAAPLQFSREEWRAFVAGVKADEFGA